MTISYTLFCYRFVQLGILVIVLKSIESIVLKHIPVVVNLHTRNAFASSCVIKTTIVNIVYEVAQCMIRMILGFL
jgi:hypothetical protein